MEDYLEIDLNQVINERVAKEIKSLKSQLKQSNEHAYRLSDQLAQKNKQLSDVSAVSDLMTSLRAAFENIKSNPKSDSEYERGAEQNRYRFISNVMLSLFGIKSATGVEKGGLGAVLSVNYYDHKDIVIGLVKALMADHSKVTSFISSFKMPYDYSKDEVIKYVQAPHYCTNGALFGVSSFWVKQGAGSKSNVPHDLIQKNPHILSKDVFSAVIDTINRRTRSEFYLLFGIGVYNLDISDAQVKQLSSMLTTLSDAHLGYEPVKKFISDRIHQFSEEAIEFLFKKATSGNQYNMLHWEKFPEDYQERFLMKSDLPQALTCIQNYSCQWSVERKENFLRKFLDQNQIR